MKAMIQRRFPDPVHNEKGHPFIPRERYSTVFAAPQNGMRNLILLRLGG